MLDKGFAPDVERIINTTPPDRQTALFSATTPDWVKHVSAKYLYEPETIAIGTETEAEPDIEHSVIEVWDGDKLQRPREPADHAHRGRDPCLRPHPPRRHEPRPAPAEARLRGRSAPGRPRPAGARPHRQALPRRPPAHPARDQRRGPRPRHAEHRARDQLRPAGDAASCSSTASAAPAAWAAPARRSRSSRRPTCSKMQRDRARPQAPFPAHPRSGGDAHARPHRYPAGAHRGQGRTSVHRPISDSDETPPTPSLPGRTVEPGGPAGHIRRLTASGLGAR